jgi:DNA repair protein RecO (recombination protein O)
MLHTTQGIVLHSFKYSDTSVVARILTHNLGLQSYLVQGVRKKGSKVKASLFQHLNLVDLVVWHKDSQGLQRIKEIQCSHPLVNLGIDIRKSTIAMFLSEMLLNAFQHQQETQPAAFRFITDSVLQLEEMEENLSLFHIIFLFELTRHLGFAPATGYSDDKCHFNLREGIYEKIPDSLSLDSPESQYFSMLTQVSLQDKSLPRVPPPVRRNILRHLVTYYRLHMEGFREIKSLEILETVFQ